MNKLIMVIMGFILDGWSFHYAHKQSKSGISIRFDLFKAFGYIENVVKIKYFQKIPNLHHMGATCSDLIFKLYLDGNSEMLRTHEGKEVFSKEKISIHDCSRSNCVP